MTDERTIMLAGIKVGEDLSLRAEKLRVEVRHFKQVIRSSTTLSPSQKKELLDSLCKASTALAEEIAGVDGNLLELYEILDRDI